MSRNRQSKRFTQSRRDRQEQFEQFQIENSLRAQQEGPSKKKWTHHDMTAVRPLTEHQQDAFQCWYQDKTGHLAMLGSAGCGKSFLAIYLAMMEVLDPRTPQTKLKIVRSIVQTRQIGAIPGTLEEKKAPLFDVYNTIFVDLFGRVHTMRDMIAAGIVELVDTSYIRGDTWENCIVFVDEVTSMNDHEVHTVMTRVGQDSRVIIAGDEKQSDLATTGNKADKHNYARFRAILDRMNTICVVDFTADDIVRSGFVKDWIVASQSY